VSYRYDADMLSLRNHFNRRLAVNPLRECGLLKQLLLELFLCTVLNSVCVVADPLCELGLMFDTRTYSTRASVHSLYGALSLLVLLHLYHPAR
jgi:hypothetical protein